MPEKNFGIRDIVPNNIRDNVPNTKNSYFQMSSTMSLIPKKMSLIPNSVELMSLSRSERTPACWPDDVAPAAAPLAPAADATLTARGPLLLCRRVY